MGARITLLDPALRPLLDAAGLRDYADFVDCDIGQVVSGTGTTLTRRIDLSIAGRHDAIYLKRYRYAGDRWRHRFRRHKGAAEARNYVHLRERCGINVPDVIAYGARRRGWRLLDAFLVTRAVPGGLPLDDAWTVLTGSREDRRTLLRDTAAIVARMHAAHFYHCDLQWRNILVRREARGFAIFVIDSSRGGPRRTAPGRTHGRTRDLSSLDKLGRVRLTATERLAWLRHYCGPDTSKADQRRLIRAVARYGASKAD